MLWIWKHHLFSAWIIHFLWRHLPHCKWPASPVTNACGPEQETLFNNAFPRREHLIQWSRTCSWKAACSSGQLLTGSQNLPHHPRSLPTSNHKALLPTGLYVFPGSNCPFSWCRPKPRDALDSGPSRSSFTERHKGGQGPWLSLHPHPDRL